MFQQTQNLSEHIVQRSVDASIILFDCVAVLIWIACLIYNKQWRPLYFCGIGFVVYYVVDAVIWMLIMKVRWIDSRHNPYLVQIWLQLGPGVIHPSFAVLMLEGTFGPNRQKVNRSFWALLFLLVQFTPCFLQQSFQWNDRIVIGRNMGSQRWLFVMLGILGYFYLIHLKMNAADLWKCFLIAFSVEGLFELSLYVSDIRVASLKTMLIDSVLEFNVGIGLIFFLWKCMIPKEDRCKNNISVDNEKSV